MSYELGSQIAKGLELCADMDARHRQEGRQAWAIGDTSKLYSAMHWIGYNEASAGAQVKLWTGDPAAARWQAEGAPSCDATWAAATLLCFECGEEIPEGAEHQDDDGNYYCSACCDSPEPEPEWPSDNWCMCQDGIGHGPCPKCGKQMFPF